MSRTETACFYSSSHRGATFRRAGLGLALAVLLFAATPPATAQEGATGAVAQSDLLPLWGVNLSFPPDWVDGTSFPSQSDAHPFAGVNPAFQQVWDALQPNGFNVLRLPLDTSAPAAAAVRLANLCVWAQGNGVFLLPILTVQSSATDFSANAAAVVAGAVTWLAQGAGGELFSAYSQILAYQVGNRMNHPGWHGGTAGATAQLRVSQAAGAIRRAELEALASAGLPATPLVAGASFDYEVVRAGGGVSCPLSTETFDAAYAGVHGFLGELAAAPEIDALNVEWFAGSLSAGGVESFPELLARLATDIPGKQLSLTTGFSTAFATPEEQQRFLALTFANVADHRASEGDASPFIGVFFHEAVEGLWADPPPPTPDLPADVAQWDWCSRSAELTQVWRGELDSPDLLWWQETTANHMGLLGLSLDETGAATLVPLAGQQAFTAIAESVSGAGAGSAGVAGGAGGAEGLVREFGDALKDTAKVAMVSLLSRVLDELASKITFGGGSHDDVGGWAEPSGEEAIPDEAPGGPPSSEPSGEISGAGATELGPGTVLGKTPSLAATATATLVTCGPRITAIRFAAGGAHPPVGQSAVTVSLSNPCSTAAKPLTAALLLDGSRVQSRSTGLLLPSQTRTVVFGDVEFAAGSPVTVGVVLESQRKGTSTQVASRSTTVAPGKQVTPAKIATASTRTLIPGAVVSQSSKGVRTLTPAADAASTASATTQAGKGTRGFPISPAPAPTPRPTARPAPAPAIAATAKTSKATALPTLARPTPTPTRPAMATLVAPAAKITKAAPPPTPAPRPDLTVARGDIKATFPTSSSAPLRFDITVHNRGSARASGARVLCILRADGKEVARKQLTASVQPGSQGRVSWSTKMPSAKRLSIEVSVSVAGETDRGDNRAMLDLAVPALKSLTKR